MTDPQSSFAVGALVLALIAALAYSILQIRRLKNELLGWKVAAEAAEVVSKHYRRKFINERVKHDIDRIDADLDEKNAEIKKPVTQQSESPKRRYEWTHQPQRTTLTPPPAPQTTTSYRREDTLIGGAVGFGLGMAAASALSSSGSESRCDSSDYSSSSSGYDSGSSDSGSSYSSD